MHQFRSQIAKIRALHLIAAAALSISVSVQLLAAIFPKSLIGGIAIALGVDSWGLVVALLATFAGVHRLGLARRQVEARDEARAHLIERDSLTDAYSRYRFMELLEEKLRQIRSQQIAGRPMGEFTLMLMDVDHFKKINDTFGHAAGDQVLKTIVQVAASRTNWTVGRLGGDEFAIIVEETDYRRILGEMTNFMQKLRDLLRQENDKSGYDGVSIGIAQAPLHAGFADALLTCADIALYEAKRNGRNQFAFFDLDMQRTQIRERQVSRELRAAILLNHLAVYYQPIVDQENNVVGAEALVRWHDPVRSIVIPPDEFIPVAERSGLIDRLGEWVFRQVCKDYARSGFKSIAINVSGAQLMHDELVPMLREVLRETGCRAENFMLEITETVALNATPAVINTVRQLKGMGFRLSLDDFGTGNSGFAFMRELPFDVIKIDKSYVQKLGDDPIAQVFVSGVARLGAMLGFDVVAEGIEVIRAQGFGDRRGFHPLPGLPVRQARSVAAGGSDLGARLGYPRPPQGPDRTTLPSYELRYSRSERQDNAATTIPEKWQRTCWSRCFSMVFV